MKNSEHNNPSFDPFAERMSVKRELRSVVEQYSKLINMIESTHQAKFTTGADEESNCIKRLFNKLKTI